MIKHPFALYLTLKIDSHSLYSMRAAELDRSFIDVRAVVEKRGRLTITLRQGSWVEVNARSSVSLGSKNSLELLEYSRSI